MSCRIDSIIIPNVPAIEEDRTVWEAANMMIRQHHGHVVITDKEGTTVTGFFTERDLMVRVVGPRKDPDTLPINEVMSRNLVKVEVNASCRHCLDLMRASRCRHLLVFDKGNYLGVISIRDVASQLTKDTSMQDLVSKGLVRLFVVTVVGILIFLVSFVPQMLGIVSRIPNP